MHILPDQLPWFVVGPLMGLTVVGLFAIANKPLGATTAYRESFRAVTLRKVNEAWRIWLFVGMAAGALLVSVLRGGPSFTMSYGLLGTLVPVALLIPILFGAGLLMGYGGRWSGGCTSGHGIRGMSALSPASIAATMTFMAVAVSLTFVLHVVTGGSL
jgi:uncharacterized membrane protein YedE/YeeE